MGRAQMEGGGIVRGRDYIGVGNCSSPCGLPRGEAGRGAASCSTSSITSCPRKGSTGSRPHSSARSSPANRASLNPPSTPRSAGATPTGSPPTRPRSRAITSLTTCGGGRSSSRTHTVVISSVRKADEVRKESHVCGICGLAPTELGRCPRCTAQNGETAKGLSRRQRRSELWRETDEFRNGKWEDSEAEGDH